MRMNAIERHWSRTSFAALVDLWKTAEYLSMELAILRTRLFVSIVDRHNIILGGLMTTRDMYMLRCCNKDSSKMLLKPFVFAIPQTETETGTSFGQPLTPIPPISPPSGAEGNWCGDMELCDVCHTWGPQDGFGCGRMFKPQ